MYNLIYQSVYLILVVIFAVALLVSYVMSLIHFGEHPVLAFIVGAGLGTLFFYLAPGQGIAAIFVAAAATILGNLVLSNILNKAGDKVMDRVESATDSYWAKSDSKEHQKILTSPDAQERIKFLLRHFRRESYRFTVSADMEQSYLVALQKIQAAGLTSDYPDMNIRNGDTKSGGFVIRLECPRYAISLAFGKKDLSFIAQLKLASYSDEGLSLSERIKLEKEAATLLDKVYILSGEALRTIDPNCSVTIG